MEDSKLTPLGKCGGGCKDTLSEKGSLKAESRLTRRSYKERTSSGAVEEAIQGGTYFERPVFFIDHSELSRSRKFRPTRNIRTPNRAPRSTRLTARAKKGNWNELIGVKRLPKKTRSRTHPVEGGEIEEQGCPTQNRFPGKGENPKERRTGSVAQETALSEFEITF